MPAFQDALQEMSNGTIEAEIVDTDPATIMPLPPTLCDDDNHTPELALCQSEESAHVRLLQNRHRERSEAISH